MNSKQLKFFLLKQGYRPTYVLRLVEYFKGYDTFVKELQFAKPSRGHPRR
jgi:hypothetical protein